MVLTSNKSTSLYEQMFKRSKIVLYLIITPLNDMVDKLSIYQPLPMDIQKATALREECLDANFLSSLNLVPRSCKWTTVGWQ